MIDYQLAIQDAISKSRFHHQYIPNVIYAEKEALKPEVIQQLNTLGHKVVLDKQVSIEEALLIDFKAKMIYGGSDPRRAAGKAIGY